MNVEKYFKEMFSCIWQGNDLSKLNQYYSHNFHETISVCDDKKNPQILEMNYSDIVEQARWYNENYTHTTIDIKKIVAGDKNHISVYFYSTSIYKKTGELRHRWVSGIWRLDNENKIDRVWAVVTPHYA